MARWKEKKRPSKGYCGSSHTLFTVAGLQRSLKLTEQFNKHENRLNIEQTRLLLVCVCVCVLIPCVSNDHSVGGYSDCLRGAGGQRDTAQSQAELV